MLYVTPTDAGDALNRPVVAIGNFDGVHRGHVTVVNRAVAEAKKRGVDAAVLTFEPHPVIFFRPETPEFRLTSLTQKAALLAEHGVAGTVAVRFDAELAAYSPAEFVQRVLVDALHVSAVLIGADFRFGAKRAGDVDTLRELGAGRFDVLTLPQLRADDEVISSTRIRAALRDGQLDLVSRLLGRPFAISGTVVHGDAIGRTFGFPTANIDCATPLLPPDGIYASRLHAGKTFNAATYIGTRPAVGGTERVVEAYCIDAEDLDLYEHHVEVDFIQRVRGDQDFASHDALIEQMHRDVANVRAVLSER